MFHLNVRRTTHALFEISFTDNSDNYGTQHTRRAPFCLVCENQSDQSPPRSRFPPDTTAEVVFCCSVHERYDSRWLATGSVVGFSERAVGDLSLVIERIMSGKLP